MSSSAEKKPSTAAQVTGAARNIVIAAVVLAGIFFAYARYVETSKQLKQMREKVTALVKHDNPGDYRDSAKLLDQGLALRQDVWFVAERAEVSALLWAEGGEDTSKNAAIGFSQQAAELDVNTGPRFNAEALVLIGQGQLQKADDRLNVLIQKTAPTAAMIADIGIVHEREGKLETAKSDFKQAADRDWVNPRFGSLYGEALFDNGEYPTAQSAFLKALEGNPNHFRALIGKARADIVRGERVAEASKTLDEVLGAGAALSPMLKVHALAGKAEALLALGNPQGAEATARDAIAAKVEGDTGAAYAQYDLGLALAAEKKNGALDAFQQAIATVGFIPHFYFEGALALARADQAKDGAALLAKYAAKITDASGKMKVDDNYHRTKGQFLTMSDDLDGALKEYDLAIGDNALSPESYYAKAMVYKQQATLPKADKTKLYNLAIDNFGKAIGYRERYPEAYLEVGLIYIDMNPKDDRAMEKLTKALIYYKDAKAPKAVTEAFIDRVEQRYLKAGPKFKKTASEWKTQATAALKP